MFCYTIELMQNFVFAQLHCVPCLNFVMYGGKVERMRQYGMECAYCTHCTAHVHLCSTSVLYWLGVANKKDAWYGIVHCSTLQYPWVISAWSSQLSRRWRPPGGRYSNSSPSIPLAARRIIYTAQQFWIHFLVSMILERALCSVLEWWALSP